MEQSAIERAVAAAGSQTSLAKLCGVSQPTVWAWVKAKRVPAEQVLKIERELGISRHDLRPDIYPIDGASTPASAAAETGQAGDRSGYGEEQAA